MNIQIKPVTYSDIEAYLNKYAEKELPFYLEPVVDLDSIKTLLTKPSFRIGRKAYGAFLDGEILGYAIVLEPSHTLDLIHVASKARGKGLGKALLKHTKVTNTVVNKNNKEAIALYRKLNIRIEFDDE
ncbi:putative N-acetyltransferase [Pseudomonas phage PA1C]|nr:putative N-acetyltransferase [Pseudomonas phage PA1C]